MQTNSLPPNDDKPADDHLLEDLAALTGLFSPSVLWHTEEKLNDLNEQATLEEEASLQKPTQDLTEPTNL